MLVGIDELFQLVKEKGLIENLSKRELENPEGTGFDIRLGEVYEISGEGFVGIEKRKTPEAVKIAEFGKDREIILKPGDYYLVRTIEYVRVPEDLAAFVLPRSTLFRSGVALFTTIVHPGYEGYLTFGMANLGKATFRIELGARIAHIIFVRISGKGSRYRGQWQGGRVFTPEEEEQV